MAIREVIVSGRKLKVGVNGPAERNLIPIARRFGVSSNQTEHGVSVDGHQSRRDIVSGFKREAAILATSAIVIAVIAGIGKLAGK